MYQQAGAQGGQAGPDMGGCAGGNCGGSCGTDTDPNVVDADYKVVDDDNK